MEIKRLDSCGLCPDRLGRSLNLRHDSDIRYLHYQKLKDRKFIRNHPQCIGRKLMKLFRKYYFGVRLLFLFPKLHTIRPNNVIHSKKVARYRAREEELKDLFNSHGSDKAYMHNYFEIYASILDSLVGNDIQILEFGLGTNNLKIPSNMGGHFKPGGSLRALKSFVPSAQIYGADIDYEILFNEKDIQTCWIDQTKTKTFSNIHKLLEGKSLDMIIVDGLHQPFADINTLDKVLPYLKINGDMFVEDIEDSGFVRLIWGLAKRVLSKEYYQTEMFEMRGGLVFQITRRK